MQLGFMSLILTVTQRSISKICIPNKAADYMLPCRNPKSIHTKSGFQELIGHPRMLAAAAAPSNSSDYCASKVCYYYAIISLINTS